MIISQSVSRIPSSLLICLFLGCSIVSANSYKHVASPPQDATKNALPDVKQSAITSHSTMISLDQSRTNKSQPGKWSQTLIVDSQESVPIVILSPNIDRWLITLKSPSGETFINEIEANKSLLQSRDIAMGSQQFRGKKLDLPEMSVGQWTLDLQSMQGVSKSSKPGAPPKGFILVKGDPQYKLVSHLNTRFTTEGSELALLAYMLRDSPDETPWSRNKLADAAPSMGLIDRAMLEVTLPNGQIQKLVMRDDGLAMDKQAGDGIYTASLPSHISGIYSTAVYVEGTRSDGLAFSRTSYDMFPVEKQTLAFAPEVAQGKPVSGSFWSIDIPVVEFDHHSKGIFLAAEVWGTSNKGNLQQAAWIGGIAEPVRSKSHTGLEMGFDSRWLTQNGFKAPFVLKNLRLQTVDNNTPIAKLAEMPLNMSLSARHYKGISANELSIDQKMLMRPAPGNSSELSNKIRGASALDQTYASGGKLMLVHGYCSGQAWSTSQFSNSVEFKDYRQNRTHDDFARRIRDFGAGYPSFGVVAHSQGGAAALHLYAKYMSGLDYAGSGRLIQSVGTPYRGTALAGNLAAIGKVFGVQCGKNTDLTYNGASNWLSTIPSWARSKVNYYTTSFKDRWWAYDYCHLATDLFLDDPEDGTTEKWAGQLSGGVNRGHKTGWCHTSGMRDPAQTGDSSRNSSMSSAAAR